MDEWIEEQGERRNELETRPRQYRTSARTWTAPVSVGFTPALKGGILSSQKDSETELPQPAACRENPDGCQ
ncbi:hypothetical protein GCM10025298_10250 [Natronobiforma cellulositropha]